MADAPDSKSGSGNRVRVQVPPPALTRPAKTVLSLGDVVAMCAFGRYESAAQHVTIRTDLAETCLWSMPIASSSSRFCSISSSTRWTR